MWPFRRKPNTVILGGKRITITPLTLPQAIEITLLLAPYWPTLDEKIPQIERAMVKGDKDILTHIFFAMREKMKDTPGDITKVVAILAGVDPQWLAANGTAQEVLVALPTLNKAHNLNRLWGIVRQGTFYFSK